MIGIRGSILCMYVGCACRDGTFQSSPNQFLLMRVHIQQMCGWLQAEEMLLLLLLLLSRFSRVRLCATPETAAH